MVEQSRGHGRRWLAPAAALLCVAAYVAVARFAGLHGFPLDDAWIHQTYARNLAATGQLAYVPGHPSAGSTSPAWSFLLSIAYLLGLDPALWTHLLGGLSLAASAWFVYRLVSRLVNSKSAEAGLRPSPAWRGAALLAGLLCALEWHLVWAGASGMETALFTALSLWLIDRFWAQVAFREAPPDGPASFQIQEAAVAAISSGVLGAALVLTRPEGIGLVALVVAGSLLLPWPPHRDLLRSRALLAAATVVAFALVLTPYLFFNYQTAGTPWPNTLYAKQAEYGFALSLPARLWRVISPTLVGAQLLLLPGAIYGAYRLLHERRWAMLLPAAWWLGFVIVYALRLPVSYQHGRYTIPTIPILIVYGVWGTATLLRPRSPHLLVRVLSRATPAAVAILALLFFARGALAYRDDVAFIDGEMVDVAGWLDEQVPPGTLIAVHDIGAVGYLSPHPLLDLAGLITPEVIPFITDAERLAAFMVEEGADYAVFFPDFSPTYAQLAADPRFRPVYCADHAWTRAQGRANMCVYQIVE
ncbi:MAG: hypothetical protein JXA93_06705 [Anaerolineae bacterium]|nr:hypothetical protein [Anaerolineae bacterium]